MDTWLCKNCQAQHPVQYKGCPISLQQRADVEGTWPCTHCQAQHPSEYKGCPVSLQRRTDVEVQRPTDSLIKALQSHDYGGGNPSISTDLQVALMGMHKKDSERQHLNSESSR
jgi:hypothetical protein